MNGLLLLDSLLVYHKSAVHPHFSGIGRSHIPAVRLVIHVYMQCSNKWISNMTTVSESDPVIRLHSVYLSYLINYGLNRISKFENFDIDFSGTAFPGQRGRF